MYKVTVKHYGPKVRRGDTEGDWSIINVETFKLKKDAKNWILGQVPDKATKEWKTGNETSRVYYKTNRNWRNEGTGEYDTETYLYLLDKI